MTGLVCNLFPPSLTLWLAEQPGPERSGRDGAAGHPLSAEPGGGDGSDHLGGTALLRLHVHAADDPGRVAAAVRPVP